MLLRQSVNTDRRQHQSVSEYASIAMATHRSSWNLQSTAAQNNSAFATLWQKNAYGALQVWTQATTYLQLIGILIGQLVLGVMGDWIGRKATMLIDISVILLGIILLTGSNGPTINVSSFLDSSSSSCCSSASVYLERLQKAQGSVFVLNIAVHACCRPTHVLTNAVLMLV